MEGDYLIQVDQQMTCAIFVHIMFLLTSQRRKITCNVLRTFESKEPTVISGDKKGINELEILF